MSRPTLSPPSAPDALDRFTLPVEVVIRTCRRDDLPALEWFGMFAAHRAILRDTFESQERGETVMLVAEANGFPVGQAWINLTLKQAEAVGALWAVRVLPCFQNLGIGTRLMAAAEAVLRGRGYVAVELGVERDNPAARRFYERLGYRVVDTARGEYTYSPPDGAPVRVPIDEWIMRKELDAGAEERA